MNGSVNYDTNITTRGRPSDTRGESGLDTGGETDLDTGGETDLDTGGESGRDKGSLPLTLDGGCLGVRVPHLETSTNLNPKGADTDSS